MNHFQLPPYGHGFCPHCLTGFDLTDAEPTFAERLPHNDQLIYVLCPVCHPKFKSGGDRGRKGISDRCFINVKLSGRCPDGRIPGWALTSSLTLALNDYDLVLALENGHGLTREQYFSICSGSYAVTALPGGGAIICSDSSATPSRRQPHATGGSTSQVSRKDSSATKTHRPDGGEK